MPFKPGNPGRPKGAQNKRTQEVQEILARKNFCPTTALMEINKIAMARFVEELELVQSGRYSPMECNAHSYLRMALDSAKELASFVNPKLKAIEQVVSNPLADMTPQQRLEAMRQAVKVLEHQVKDDGPGVT